MRYGKVDEPNGDHGAGLPASIQHPNDQKWPRPGKDVTFVAHLRNGGTRPTPSVEGACKIDGQQVETGWGDPLAPDDERRHEIKSPWRSGRRHDAFEAVFERKFAEVNRMSNFVVDALICHFFVQPGLQAWFANVKNGLGSYSWDDWAQFQVREMNRTFRDEIHPAMPGCISIRIRLDKITMLPADFVDLMDARAQRHGQRHERLGWSVGLC